MEDSLKHGWLMVVFCAVLWLPSGPAQAGFDHGHSGWHALVQQHVRWRDGVASEVDYGGIKAQSGELDAYTASLSAVSRRAFDAWTKPQQLAFLINAYNAFTVQLVLSEYPDMKSIKELGGWFSSPWKLKFFDLLGERRHLDGVEHRLIRGSGRYDEPRIHVAVVCASIGCPALRDEAYRPDVLEAQLADSMRRFLSDRSRNRYETGRLWVSKIFDWYGGDFPSLTTLYADHAEQLADGESARTAIREGRYVLGFLEYDWRLNERR